MEINHVGITNKGEEQAILLYQDFLGFEKTREILLAPELSKGETKGSFVNPTFAESWARLGYGI